MCGLFGFSSYGGDIKNCTGLTNALAEHSAVRGTDATGTAYLRNSNIQIQKEAKSAYALNFKMPDHTSTLIGHTRHATHGSEQHGFNNHPFFGKAGHTRFALAHNGVLYGVEETRYTHKLPKTKIETDSYLAVQLIEQQKKFSPDSVRYMAETVRGSFSFSILDDRNTIWLVKGDSPLSILHFPEKKIYVYASTDEILYKSIVDSFLFDELKKGRFEEVRIRAGEIMQICSDGEIHTDSFIFKEAARPAWWEYGVYRDPVIADADEMYLDALRTTALWQGVDPDVIDELYASGYTLEEIEDVVYEI